MHDVAPVINLHRRDRMLTLAFVSALIALVATFSAVGSTIPLFNIYRAEEGFTTADISLTVVAYLSAIFSVPQISLGYGGLALIATLVTVFAARNPQTHSAKG